MAQTFLFNVDITCEACTSALDHAIPENHPTLGKVTRSYDILAQTMLITVANDELPRDRVCGMIKEMIDDTGIECTAPATEVVEEVAVVAQPSDNITDAADTREPTTSTPPSPDQRRRRKIIKNVIKGAIGIVAGAGFIALMLSGVALPMVAMYAVVGVSSALTIALGAESYFDATKKLIKSGTLTMDALFTISSLAMIAVSIASLFVPWLPMMCEAGVLIFGFRFMGKAIEESIKQKISSQIKFADRGAKKVKKYHPANDTWEELDADHIRIDDIIRIKAGDTIPVDGIYEHESPSHTVYKTIINGSEEAQRIRKGEALYAGMVVPAHIEYIEMRALKTKEFSHLCRSDRESAAIVVAPIQKVVNQIMQYFIPGVFILAAVSGIVIGAVFGLSLAIQCIASVLVSACPCTFGMISPLAMQMGIAKSKAHGVHFKDAAALESADKIDHVVFDLNGTLTAGTPEVTGHHFYTKEKYHAKLFRIIEAMEAQSDHKIALAVQGYTRTKNIGKSPITLSNINKDNHSGIQAECEGDQYLLGNLQYLRDHHIQDIPTITLAADDASQIVYVVKNGRVVGHFKVEDPLRKDAKFVIDELKLLGKKIHICTGADTETAMRYARKLGIDEANIYANCVSLATADNTRTKKNIIEILQEENKKRVAMVGDASNDANAIKQSNFGIAVKSASSDVMTQQNAGATIDNSTLLPVVTAFAAAKQTIFSIKQNLIISIAYNMTMILIAGGILIAIGFALNPAIGVALMVVQAALILLNQYRIYRQKFDHIKRYEEQEKLHNDHEEPGSSTSLMHQKGLTINPTPAPIVSAAQQMSPPALEAVTPRSLAQGAQPQALASSYLEASRISQTASAENPLYESYRH